MILHCTILIPLKEKEINRKHTGDRFKNKDF